MSKILKRAMSFFNLSKWKDATLQLPKDDREVLIEYRLGADKEYCVARYCTDKWIVEVVGDNEYHEYCYFILRCNVLRWKPIK